MNIDERTRHALHERLDVVLGPEEAVTLMSYLPPVGWADVATKGDIDHLAAATKRDLDVLANQLRAELHKEIGSVRGEMSKQTRTFVLSLMGSNATLAALAFAAARLV